MQLNYFFTFSIIINILNSLFILGAYSPSKIDEPFLQNLGKTVLPGVEDGVILKKEVANFFNQE